MMRIEEIGEFGLIERIAALLAAEGTADERVLLGVGDDAAIWQPAAGEALVVSTDTLIETIHFRLDLMSWADLGHRALAVNLSDLAAMGARPGAAVVTIGLRAGLTVEAVLDLYRGMAALARRAGCALIGGDIVAAPTAIAITVTVFGEVRLAADGQPRALRRDAGRAGELVAVTGPLGLSAAGLRHLLATPTAAAVDGAVGALVAAYRRPEPRLMIGQTLVEQGVRAGMDLSDGLAGDLPKLCQRSGVSAVIESARLPVPASVRERYPDHWLELALRGGEDFELLVTLAPERLAAVQAALLARRLPALTVIGQLAPAGPDTLLLVDAAGRRQPLVPGAFDHFAVIE